MKLVLIGPVYPFKGGISHYTGMMCRELQKQHDVTMISFKMQYPKILFKKEQKDYRNDKFRIEDTNYWINTMNPINIISVANKINKLKPDGVIIQWWHPYFAPCYWFLCKFIKHSKIIFVCHNVFPHERFPMDRLLTKITMKLGNAFILHSMQEADELKTIIDKPQYEVTPHPTYNMFRMRGISKEKAREEICEDMDTKMLLFFGFVREYKGLKYLLDAIPLIKKELKSIKLYIVGDFGEDKSQYYDQIRTLEIENEVKIVEGYVPDEDVEKYFAACDLVILPYISATQSGIVQIAFGFEKPVVVTNVGGLPDVVINGKTGYVVPEKNEGAIVKAILNYFEENKQDEFIQNIKQEAYRFSWERMGEKIEELLQ